MIHIEHVTSSMRLARPIYHKNGSTILLNEGCGNLPAYKNKLSELNIHYLYIEDELSQGIVINDTVSEKTRQKGKKAIKDAISQVAQGKNLNVRQVKKIVKSILNDILDNKNILIGLTDIRTSDEYTFTHSVNVAVLSVILGNALHYDKYQLQKLGVGALLHDIGKAKIPNDIINKPGKLTSEEFHVIQEHPQLGFDAVKNNWELSPLSRTVILCHHEKVNGSGYPRRVSGTEIHVFAKIVAICDIFDALSADRCYSPKWELTEVIAHLRKISGTELDPVLTEKFISLVTPYPTGSIVNLPDGRRGIVFAQNKKNIQRPVLRIFEENAQRLLPEQFYLLDLSAAPEIRL